METRNFLAHDYFQDRKFIATCDGSGTYLVAELTSITGEFRHWAKELEVWVDEVARFLGVAPNAPASPLAARFDIP